MKLAYALTPMMAWLFAGTMKFLINSITHRQWALEHIGYGGFPSNHSAIVTSAVAVVALKEGIDTPLFTVALAFAAIVMLDACSLRRQIGRQAAALNQLVKDDTSAPLRERIGHTPCQIAGGIVVGMISAYLVVFFLG